MGDRSDKACWMESRVLRWEWTLASLTREVYVLQTTVTEWLFSAIEDDLANSERRLRGVDKDWRLFRMAGLLSMQDTYTTRIRFHWSDTMSQLPIGGLELLNSNCRLFVHVILKFTTDVLHSTNDRSIPHNFCLCGRLLVTNFIWSESLVVWRQLRYTLCFPFCQILSTWCTRLDARISILVLIRVANCKSEWGFLPLTSVFFLRAGSALRSRSSKAHSGKIRGMESDWCLTSFSKSLSHHFANCRLRESTIELCVKINLCPGSGRPRPPPPAWPALALLPHGR